MRSTMYIDEYGNEHTVESLTKRFNAIPDWYWAKRKDQKTMTEQMFRKGQLQPIVDFLEYVEAKVEDWRSDIETFY